MEARWKRNTGWIFFAVFSLFFTYLLACLLFGNTEYSYSKLLLYPCLALFLLVVMLCRHCFGRYEATLNRYYPVILAVFLTCMGLIQIFLGYWLRYQPVFDLGAIYNGAIQWVETGSFQDYYDYFYMFPNNLGGLVFLYLFFRLASFAGVTDYFMVAVVVNSFLSVGMMLVTSFVCRKLFSGCKHALLLLVFFACSLPFYFIGPVFYTDALSMLYPVLLLLIYLKMKETDRLAKHIWYGALLGLAAAVGMLVKFTVLIMLIAIGISMVFHKNWKQYLSAAVSAVLVILVVFASFHSFLYPRHLDKATAEQKNAPYCHWIMMGLMGNGTYTNDAYVFSFSYEDPEERREAIWGKIVDLLRERQPDGLADLWTRKAVRSFGDSTYALSDFLDNTPVHQLGLHRYILYRGDFYGLYQALCGGVFFGMLLLLLFSGYHGLAGKKRVLTDCLIPQTALFGLLLFLIMWEANGRYIVNYIPVIFLGAVMGVDCFARAGRSLLGAMWRTVSNWKDKLPDTGAQDTKKLGTDELRSE